MIIKTKNMRTIKGLKEIKKAYEDRLASVYEADADPDIIAVHISDLQYAITCIENQIEFEQKLIPLKLMLIGFIIFCVTLLIFHTI